MGDMNIVRLRSSLLVLAACSCAGQPRSSTTVDPSRVGVQLDANEAHAALAILQTRRAAQPVSDAAWQKLFTVDGYTHLRERELAMGRPFTDSAFRAFL